VPAVRLIHWNAADAEARAAQLRALGFTVEAGPVDPAGIKALLASPPAAVVIDLSRMPMQGRDVGIGLRTRAATRRVPLLFVGGEPEKVARTRETLPDAVYTTWEEIGPALAPALASPPADPVVPANNLAGYSGTPLPKKLGIKPGTVVGLVDAPAGFEAVLGELPEGVEVCRNGSQSADLTLWFPASAADLQARVAAIGAASGPAGLWIAWPKKTSGVVSDLSETLVRQAGLANGLVDYKICAIDATWSGLKFARRRSGVKRID
jgi:hypothetical protein